MKKVININFQGQVISIEESAYNILKQYLDLLRKHFSKEQDGDEIVIDIETRIAELFSNRIKNGAGCITDIDVEDVIERVGRPEDFDIEFAEDNTTEKKQEQSTSEKQEDSKSSKEKNNTNKENRFEGFKDMARRPLFRKANDKILGGVCSGMASYLSIDPVFTRLLFVLFSPAMFVLYLILWIILPERVLPTNISKRMYRHPNNRLIGGVCGGIAAYFNIEAWIPRVIFVIATLFSSTTAFPFNFPFVLMSQYFVLVYIVLWIILPEAKTKEQQQEMMGEEEYINSIKDKMGESFSEERQASTNDRENDKKNKDYQYINTSRSGCRDFILVFLKIILFVFIIACICSTVSIVLLLADGLMRGYGIFNLSLHIFPYAGVPLFAVAIALSVILPVLAGIVWVLRRIKKSKKRPVLAILFCLIWTASILFTLFSYDKARQYGSMGMSTIRESYELAPTTSDRLHIVVEKELKNIEERKGAKVQTLANMRNVKFVELNDTTFVNNIAVRIDVSEDSTSYVQVRKRAAMGNLLNSYSMYAHNIEYDFEQNDSILYLPDYFYSPKSSYQAQEILITIKVPKHIDIHKDSNLYEMERRDKQRSDKIERVKIRKTKTIRE